MTVLRRLETHIQSLRGRNEIRLDYAVLSKKDEIIERLSPLGRVLEQVADGRQLILAFGGVDVVRNRHQANIVLREKLLGQPPHLNVVAAQPGQILHKHGSSLAGGKLLHHVVETGAVHRDAGNAIVQEVDQVGVTFFLRHLGQQFLLGRDLSRVFSPLIMICR